MEKQIPRPGQKIRIVRMDDNGGKDKQAQTYNGKTVTVTYVDSLCQIHFKEGGLAVIPELDEYEIL